VYGSDDPRVVERTCERLGQTVAWNHGRLRASSVRRVVVPHPITGEEVWFGQPHLFELSPRFLGRVRYFEARLASVHPDLRSHHASWGDGSPIERDVLEHLRDVLEANTVEVQLGRGDFVAIDNVLCMHGRRRFRGPRRILVTMTR
jgi:hypothetical protein